MEIIYFSTFDQCNKALVIYQSCLFYEMAEQNFNLVISSHSNEKLNLSQYLNCKMYNKESILCLQLLCNKRTIKEKKSITQNKLFTGIHLTKNQMMLKDNF